MEIKGKTKKESLFHSGLLLHNRESIRLRFTGKVSWLVTLPPSFSS